MRYFILILPLVLVSFSSCELFEDTLSTDIDTELSQTFNLSISEQDNLTYAETKIISVEDDPDVRDYIDNIKDYTINEVYYTITGYAGAEDITFSGSVAFSSPESNDATTLVIFDDLLIPTFADGQKHDFATEADSIEVAENILLNYEAIKIYLAGTFSDAPVSFNLTVYYDVTVKASVLD